MDLLSFIQVRTFIQEKVAFKRACHDTIVSHLTRGNSYSHLPDVSIIFRDLSFFYKSVSAVFIPSVQTLTN